MKYTSYKAKKPEADGTIAYTREEDAVWADLMEAQKDSLQKYMSKQYLDGLAILDLPEKRIPQCKEVSEKIFPLTGWVVEPVPALIGFKRFFTMLSECRFPAASFIRRREHFKYITEPDIFHEILGHVPLLTHKQLADFSQKIGETGLKVAESDYARLIRLYWFTIEFGLIKEGNELKALGSGLASSVEELEYSIIGNPVLRGFDVMNILRTSYRIDIPQPVYYVLENLDDLLTIPQRNLVEDINHSRKLGNLTPLYPPKELKTA